jgi:hypothetical protein
VPTERVIDLANQRYADREYEGELPESTAADERYREQRREMALARLRRRVRETPGRGVKFLTRSDLTDLLIVLGKDDW